MMLGKFRDRLAVRRRRHTGSIPTPRGPDDRDKAGLTAIETIRATRTIRLLGDRGIDDHLATL